MFIPKSDLKRYIKVVMGFLVILAIVTPFLTIFRNSFNFSEFNEKIFSTINDIEIQEIVTLGREMQKKYSDQALTSYKSALAHQIKNHLLDIIEVNGTQVSVNIELFDDIEEESFGRPKKIDVILEHKDVGRDFQIKPVKIKINMLSDKTEIINNELAAKIRDNLSKSYNVSQEMIYVEVRKDE